MSRIVRREAVAPKMISAEEAKFPMAICACGLTSNFPYCNGSHTQTKQEEPGKLYEYSNNQAKEVRVESV